jgi:hypothetical protein
MEYSRAIFRTSIIVGVGALNLREIEIVSLSSRDVGHPEVKL